MMINPLKVIDEICKTCKLYFSESTLFFNHTHNNRFYVTGNNISKAINNYNNVKEEIDVIKWFDDFWLYIHIRFEKGSNKNFNTFLTLSVFQGDTSDNVKNQLFRAEWDNYDDEVTHPQPHWHIYTNQSLEKSFEEFVSMVDEDGGFAEMLSEEKSKGLDIQKIHFSMMGLWATNGGHINRIDDELTIVSWFQGVLVHIRSQIEYAIG